MRNDTAILIAGGWSVSAVDVRDLTARGFVIGINEAAVLCKVNAALTMDRLWFESRWPVLKERGTSTYVRIDACKFVKTAPGELWIFENDNKSTIMVDGVGTLNGTNSAMCALNLAYASRPKRVYLFGFDCKHGPRGEPYWYPPYPWADSKPGRLRDWSKQYDGVAKQFKARGVAVYNVSRWTALTCFPVITPERFLKDTS